MTTVVLLDAGPLGILTNPKASAEVFRCSQWMRALLGKGMRAAVPEIADYEVRRELLRAGKGRGLSRLYDFCNRLDYVPLTTPVMRQAAEFWARARQMGKPTASDAALDGDMILSAQAAVVGGEGYQVIVATTNPRHLDLFVDARRWHEIT